MKYGSGANSSSEPDESDEAAESGVDLLARRTARSAAWTMAGYVGSQVIRLASNLVLTRLLFEEAFGVMALMQVILQGLFLLSDIGIGPSLIHNERVDRRFVDTAFTMAAIRGVILFLLGWSVASPLAEFYEKPELSLYLPFIAFTAVLNGFESTKNHTLNRELRVERIQIARLASQLVGTVTTIVWALVEPTVWSLVGGVFVTAASRLVLGHLFLPGALNRIDWDPSAVRALVRYGSWIFLGTLLSFLSEQADRLVFGKLVSLETLGVYSIGLMIATLPFTGLAQLSWKILFPFFSRLPPDPGAFSSSFTRTRRPLFVLGGWSIAGLIAGGPAAVRLLYDSRYEEAGWMVQIISVGIWFQLVSVTNDAAAWGRGRPQLASLASSAKLVGIAVLIPLGYRVGQSLDPRFAFAGALVGFACTDVVRYLASAAASTRLGVRPWRQDIGVTVMVLGTGLAGAWVEHSLRAAGAVPAVGCAAIFVLISMLWAPLGWPLLRARLLDRRRTRSRDGRS